MESTSKSNLTTTSQQTGCDRNTAWEDSRQTRGAEERSRHIEEGALSSWERILQNGKSPQHPRGE